VLLTSSSDHTLRIHDALSPTLRTVRTLTAHTAAVTGVAIVDRGRNVLSASKDGTVRLWDVGGIKEIALRRWSTGAGAVAALCLDAGEGWPGYDSSWRGEGNSQILPAAGEVGTENKLVFAGLQDGRVEGYDLRSKRSAFSFSPRKSGRGQVATSNTAAAAAAAAIDSIAFAPDASMLAVGARSGILRWWDVRSCGQGEGPPLCEFKRNGAGIESLGWIPGEWARSSTPLPSTTTSRGEEEESLARGLPHLVIGTADGLPWRAGLTPDARVVVVEEYVGYECGDGVRATRWCPGGGGGGGRSGGHEALGRGVWCAGDDGLVRLY
jgi:proteasomal ATPase-associated factor 1